MEQLRKTQLHDRRERETCEQAQLFHSIVCGNALEVECALNSSSIGEEPSEVANKVFTAGPGRGLTPLASAAYCPVPERRAQVAQVLTQAGARPGAKLPDFGNVSATDVLKSG
ncbi:MAG: hypothetical protein MHM6MM_002289 [Cercozoa sp. M6MM]